MRLCAVVGSETEGKLFVPANTMLRKDCRNSETQFGAVSVWRLSVHMLALCHDDAAGRRPGQDGRRSWFEMQGWLSAILLLSAHAPTHHSAVAFVWHSSWVLPVHCFAPVLVSSLDCLTTTRHDHLRRSVAPRLCMTSEPAHPKRQRPQ